MGTQMVEAGLGKLLLVGDVAVVQVGGRVPVGLLLLWSGLDILVKLGLELAEKDYEQKKYFSIFAVVHCSKKDL